MNLHFDPTLAKNYHSQAQIIRVLSESWVKDNGYCPNYSTQPLRDFANGRPVAIVDVVAKNEQDALLKAQERYRKEEIILYPDDLVGTKFNIFERDS